MKEVKSLLPILVLLFVAFYGYQEYEQLPLSATIGITYLSHMLALIAAGLSIRFSRSSVFFYVLLVVIVNVILRFSWAQDTLAYGLFSIFIPLLLVVLTLLPDRGIFSFRAIPAYAALVLAAAVSVTLVLTAPDWAAQAVLRDWLPPHYFDWTGQSQSVVFVSFACFYVMLTLCVTKPSPHTCTGFGVLVALIAQLHFGDSGGSLNVFGGTALLMCLYATLQETWRMAYIDELTGLPGRRALKEKFQKIGSRYTVAMLDVDHFKRFNDTFGHDAGDAVLRMIASKMTRISGGGLPYRYGGEEFTVVFTGKNSRDAARHLDNLRVEIANKPFVIRRVGRRTGDNPVKTSVNNTIKITVSIGFAESGNGETTPWDVLKRADQALYRAKGKGRNCISE